MLEASIKLGCPLDSIDTVRELMIDAGFVDVVKRAYCWPMNQWPKNRRLKTMGKVVQCVRGKTFEELLTFGP